MASPLRLAIAATGDVGAAVDGAWASVTATFERAESTMSRFRDASELTLLNRRAPRAASASRDLVRALVAADRARRVTGGRFDPRVVDALDRIGYAGVFQGAAAANRATPARVRDPGASRPARTRRPRPAGRPGGNRQGPRAPLGGPRPRPLAGRDTRRVRLPPRCGRRHRGGRVSGWRRALGRRHRGPGRRDGSAGRRVDPGSRRDRDLVGAPPSAGNATAACSTTSSIHGPASLAATASRRSRSPARIPPGRRSGRRRSSSRAPRSIAGAARSRGLAAWWVGGDGYLEMTPGARVRTTWVASEA